jgi:hypothetical protein
VLANRLADRRKNERLFVGPAKSIERGCKEESEIEKDQNLQTLGQRQDVAGSFVG